ncbi:helix-turn-helix domain-containing protein [Lactobacillus ultunensis]|uniref:DNA-binding helix-turn-helix protein n=1 Tax=Lactobacillus ultunensis DSM 16047 TaxID=525365 RepID=C2ER66_9LACO|nr:helix-turn-helix transcriptional regulator [Lactobacillus ultunensis]EEJ70955.1 DNA-binding helix-turn-helix protein [Lactobacillus ultunensis DSM 16047]KRL80880.1 transcriptional regulator [Lactobacillus ultunensis DSM 16047]QQP28978.1 helix-turn-helix transcriptional regulator [Lactobacillus ultunensis]
MNKKSFIDKYIDKRIKENPKLAKGFEQQDLNLNAAVMVRDMRDDLGMTQKEFAKYVGKPQSTISRIESGSMNVTVGLLNEIATATKIKFSRK